VRTRRASDEPVPAGRVITTVQPANELPCCEDCALTPVSPISGLGLECSVYTVCPTSSSC
jgi:hypothetical protein